MLRSSTNTFGLSWANGSQKEAQQSQLLPSGRQVLKSQLSGEKIKSKP